MTLLNGTLEARGKVLVKLNVGRGRFEAVLAVLPSVKSPTVSQAGRRRATRSRRVVEKRTINTLIPALKDAGATDILELPISKIVALTMPTGRVDRLRRARRARRTSRPTTAPSYLFHCVEIADGTRTIAVGAAVDVRAAAQVRSRRGGRHPARVTTVSDDRERAHRRRDPWRWARARSSATATSPRTPASPAVPARRPPAAPRPTIDLPWWRVVQRGRPARCPADEREQAALLRAEGVDVRDGRVVEARSAGSAADEPIARRESPPIGGSAGPAAQRVGAALDLRRTPGGCCRARRASWRLGAEAVAEALDQAGDGVDGQRRRRQIGRARPTGGWRPARTGPSRGW